MKNNDILIIDKDNLSAVVIEKIIQEEGYTNIQHIPKGLQALGMLIDINPDIVIMNVKLNDQLYEALQVAERIEEMYKIPLIIITDVIDRETIRRMKKLNNFRLIIKPYSRNELIYSINFLLNPHNNEKNAVEESLC